MKGVYTALITPFKKDKVDYGSLERLISYQLNAGVDGLVPCGTTGESPTLSIEEHKEVVRFTIKAVDKRVKVIAGTGSNSTQEAIRLAEFAEKEGADACLAVCPYYNKPTQLGLVEHYKAIATNTSLGVILYNVPGRTSLRIENETIHELSKVKNIIGVKDATGDLDFTSETLSKALSPFFVVSGNDTQIFPTMCLGVSGVISVLSNVLPTEIKKLCELTLLGQWNEAKELHFKLWECASVFFIRTNPIPVKMAAYLLGLIDSPELRLPLTSLDLAEKEKLKIALKNIGKQIKNP